MASPAENEATIHASNQEGRGVSSLSGIQSQEVMASPAENEATIRASNQEGRGASRLLETGKPVEQKDVDALLAEELNQLSMNEREKISEEIHGVRRVVEETPELLAESLAALVQELISIPSKPAYELAEQLSNQYVTDLKFRLMFLRAEDFDARKAASRLVSFLSLKLELFGAEKLVRPIFLSDLDKEDMATLKSGIVQLLPARDRAGRAVIIDVKRGNSLSYKTTKNMAKTFFYLALAAAEDVETQRLGLVIISYYVGPTPFNFDRELCSQAPKFASGFPARLKCCHLCHKSPTMRPIISLAMLLAGGYIRSRLRVHDGPHTECQYGLLTFGVPVQFLPITYNGELKTANHSKWIAKRRIKDSVLKRQCEFNGIDLPGVNDVLVGRGKPFRDHLGNVLLRHMIEKQIDEYTRATSVTGKAAIAGDIMREIQKEGVFLKRNTDGWWVVVSDKEAEDKVRHAFRSLSSSRPPELDEPRFVTMDNQKRAKLQH